MTAPAIRIEHLVKTYPAGSGQTKRAVNDATFDIPAGQIVSFLGPNGAGKTTTLRMILGLARPTMPPRPQTPSDNRSDTCPMSQVSRPG